MRLYLGRGPRKVRNIPAYISRISEEADAAPFWAVCQKTPANMRSIISPPVQQYQIS
jgi:hypothetical protein